MKDREDRHTDRRVERLLAKALRGLSPGSMVQIFFEPQPSMRIFEAGTRVFEAGGGLTEDEVYKHVIRFNRQQGRKA